MPRIKLSDELKEAVKLMPDKEKSKLLLRLLPKDELLVEKLEYELIELGETMEERRAEVRRRIAKSIEGMPVYIRYPRDILYFLRKYSGLITRHKNITGDKVGEIVLQLFMLTESLEVNIGFLKGESAYINYKLNNYVISRGAKLNGLISKVHEDYLIDFEDEMIRLANLVEIIPGMEDEAANQGFKYSYFKKGMIY